MTSKPNKRLHLPIASVTLRAGARTAPAPLAGEDNDGADASRHAIGAAY